MSDVVGGAAVVVMPDVSGFADALAAAIGPAMAAAQSTTNAAFSDIGKDAANAGQEVQQGIGAGVLGVKDIIAGAAIGSLLADGVKAGATLAIDALGEIGSFLPELGAEFDSAFDHFQIAVGASGDKLADLESQFRDVASTVPSSFGDVSDAVAVVSKRLGQTGPAAEQITKQFLDLSRITGTDLSSNLKTVTGAFKNFGVGTDDQSAALDRLFRVSQESLVSMSDLTQGLSTIGPLARQVGLNMDETAGFIGLLGEQGIDASSGTQAFTKVLQQAKKDGVDAKVEFQKLFTGISNGTIQAGSDANVFTGRAAKMFDLIQSGSLNYEDFTKKIAAGTGTIEGTAAATDDWQERLGTLVNQLKLGLEPVASFVFGSITSAIDAIAPVVQQAATALEAILAPALQSLVGALTPVWDFIGKIKDGFAAFFTALQQGDEIFGGIEAFFYTLTGSEETANNISSAIYDFAHAVGDLWDKLQPVRDALSSAFNTIKDFIAQNPGAVFAGLAATVGAIVVPALVGLASVLGGIIITIGSAVASFLAIPLAIGAAVAAVIYAYNNFDGFRDLVNRVIDAGKGLIDWFLQAPPLVQALISPLAAIVLHFDGFKQGIADAFGVAQDKFAQLWPLLVTVGDGFKGMWASIQPAIDGLITSLKPLIQWLIDHWQILAGILLLPLAPLKLIWDHLSQIVEILKPFIAAFMDIAGHVITDVINVVTGLVDILTGLFTLDWNKVGDGIYKIASAILDFLGNLGGHLVDALKALGPIVLEALGALASNLPGWIATAASALGSAVVTLLSNIPGWIVTALEGLGALLVTALTAAWDWVVQNGPGILSTIGGWLAQVPGLLLGWLGDLGSLLVGWLGSAFGWVVSNAGTILADIGNWIAGIPQMLLDQLSTGLSFILTFLYNAVKWVIDNGPNLISGLIGFFAELPGKIVDGIGNLGDFLYNNVFYPAALWLVQNWPAIRDKVTGFFSELPGNILSALGNLGSTLFNWLKSAFQWIVDNGPSLIQSLVDWFSGLPATLFNAFKSAIGSIGGIAADIGKSIYNAFASFINDHLIAPLASFKVSITGLGDFTPFSLIDNIKLPMLAHGAVVNGPTLAVIGEAGREAVVPLDRPADRQRIMDQAGLSTSRSGGDTSITFGPINVDGTGLTQDDARALGDALGQAAVAAVESRRMQIRAAIFAA